MAGRRECNHALFACRRLVPLVVAILALCVVPAPVAALDWRDACTVQQDPPTMLTSIGLLPSGLWGSQPFYMGGRPHGPSAGALSAFEASLNRAGAALELPAPDQLPPVYIRGLRAATPLDPKFAVASELSNFEVRYRLESIDAVPLPPRNFSSAAFSSDVIAEVRPDLRLDAGTPATGRWELAMYLWYQGAPVNSSARLASFPMNLTRFTPSRPTGLKFVPRFVSTDSRNDNVTFQDIWHLAQGTSGVVTDERESAIPYEGARLCAAAGKVVRPFAVDAQFSPGTPSVAAQASNLMVTLALYDPVRSALTTQGLTGHQVRLNNLGRAVFTEFTFASATPVDTEVIAFISSASSGAPVGMLPAAFRAFVTRVTHPACSLTFAKVKSPEAWYLPEPVYAVAADPGMLVSPLHVAAGRRLPRVTVAVRDSRGELNQQMNSGVLRVRATGAAQLSASTNTEAQVIHGMATFDGLVLDAATAVVGGHAWLTFTLESSDGERQSAMNQTALHTLPLKVHSAFTRGINAIDFLPTNDAVPFNGAAMSVQQDSTLPRIQIYAMDFADSEATRGTRPTSVVVECIRLADQRSDRSQCPLVGTKSREFDRAGIATFDDLSFTTLIAGGNTFRLQFMLVDPSGRAPAATRRLRLATGPVRVMPIFDLPLVVSMRFARLSHTLFWNGWDDHAFTVTRKSPLPPVIIELLGVDGAIVEAESEIEVKASSSGGQCVISGATAYAYRGRAVFDNLMVADCHSKAAAFRITFEIGNRGRFNRAENLTLTSAPLIVARDDVPSAVLRIDSASSPFMRHSEIETMAETGTMPDIRVGVYPTSFGGAPRLPNTPLNTGTVELSSPNEVNIFGFTTASIVDGRAEFTGLQLRTQLTDMVGFRVVVCVKGIAAPCLYRRIFQRSFAPTIGFVRDSPIPVAESNDTISNDAANMTFAAGFGSYDVSTGAPLITDITPASARGTPLILKSTLPLLNNGSSVLEANLSSTGLVEFDQLNFSSATSDDGGATVDTVTDGLLAMDFELPWTAIGADGPNVRAAMYPPLRVTSVAGAGAEGTVLTVDVIKPPRLFKTQQWRRQVARMLQCDVDQLVVQRVAPSSLASTPTSAFTTRVEVRVVPARMDAKLKRSVELVTQQLLTLKPDSCDMPSGVAIRDARLLGDPAPTEKGCDGGQFAEWTEAARHCEAFQGRDARCNCFDPLFRQLGGRCIDDPTVPGLCVYLDSCLSDNIKVVCDEVTPSIALRIFLVVGGTALALLLITVFVRCQMSNTEMFRNDTLRAPKGAQKKLEAEQKHFDDVFL